MWSFVTDFFHLALSIMSKAHSHCGIYQSFFYGQIISYYMDIPILFIHLSVNGYLCCFLAIRSNTVMNIHAQVFLCIVFFHFWEGLLDPMTALTLKLFGSKLPGGSVSGYSDIPTSRYMRGTGFLHIPH